MDKEGNLQKDVMIAKLADNSDAKYKLLEDLIENCVKKTGENTCETAHKVFECYWSQRAAAAVAAVAGPRPAVATN